MTLGQYGDLWAAKHTFEKRQRYLQVHQMGMLIAMTANAGRLFEEWRKPEEFMPSDWLLDEAESILSFDEQMERVLETAFAYQAGQVARGL